MTEVTMEVREVLAGYDLSIQIGVAEGVPPEEVRRRVKEALQTAGFAVGSVEGSHHDRGGRDGYFHPDGKIREYKPCPKAFSVVQLCSHGDKYGDRDTLFFEVACPSDFAQRLEHLKRLTHEPAADNWAEVFAQDPTRGKVPVVGLVVERPGVDTDAGP